MTIDQTTLNDLCIYHSVEEESIFYKYNYTTTNGGKYYLQQLMLQPLQNVATIIDTQKTIEHLSSKSFSHSTNISNGTLMVLEKFYDTAIDTYPTTCNTVNCFFYKLFSKADFSLTKYSLQHFIQFIKGIKTLQNMLEKGLSKIIDFWIDKIELHTNKSEVKYLLQIEDVKKISDTKLLELASFIKLHFKQDCLELIDIFCKIDAYLSVAMASQKHQFCTAKFTSTQQPYINANGLYHLLLSNAVAYSVSLKKENNFLFLTGANMAGKSTFIKAVGVAVYLSHLGFPVPAQSIELSFFDGLLSNINIVDNIFKNESYFFNEVKRIKSIVEKINTNKNWLILIDELFKGTNIQDAMKCGTTVIDGLQKKDNTIFILSTHLYEIADELKRHANMQFKYFETNVANNELIFNYQLKEGVSNDKLGYLILEKEGVVKMLQ